MRTSARRSWLVPSAASWTETIVGTPSSRWRGRGRAIPPASIPSRSTSCTLPCSRSDRQVSPM
ncbi:hypothetical protein QJS66_23625 (plasmid) [Kocuria rhizophila]|nr:hypothetical protein QJS66_23625 [Kocuria rhizophila]